MFLEFKNQTRNKLKLPQIFRQAKACAETKAAMRGTVLSESDRVFMATPFPLPANFNRDYYRAALDGAELDYFPAHAKSPSWFDSQNIDLQKRFWAAYYHRGSTAAAIVVGGIPVGRFARGIVEIPAAIKGEGLALVNIFEDAIVYSTLVGKYKVEGLSGIQARVRGLSSWQFCAVFLAEDDSIVTVSSSSTRGAAFQNGRRHVEGLNVVPKVSKVITYELKVDDRRFSMAAKRASFGVA
jgi:hypothetical protein